MKVRCIDDGGWSILTAGKIYEIADESGGFYYLKGFDGGWLKERFEIVPEPKRKNDPFAGKTILRVNKNSVNVMKFYFTDGTGVELWVECSSSRLFSIPFHEVKKFTYKLRKCGRIGKVTYLP